LGQLCCYNLGVCPAILDLWIWKYTMIELVTISLIILYFAIGGVLAKLYYSSEYQWPVQLLVTMLWPVMLCIAAWMWLTD
jgi:hypothetical protein